MTSRLTLALFLLTPALARADERPAKPEVTEAERRRTAVALNYCRASFHRIRRSPTKRVLLEERERILDNLDLNGIADEEVIGLYSAVLDEIGQVRIAEREREFLRDAYRRDVHKTLANAFVGTGLQFATGQYLGALRTGASGWWDVRARGHRHELDEWGIERERQQALVSKSSRFLDTFWRLARDKEIPDRWLLRDADLERLEDALAETDPEVRLRVLDRMERYLECYPPYLYYVGRTQQELGQLFAASTTYGRMASAGTGHFRKDELLATGLANRAVIQAYLRQPGSADTARLALRHADDVWQANLACAEVLERAGRNDDAEDAILRNLDVDLEQPRSIARLVGLYHRTGNVTELRERLADAEVVRHVPGPLLVAASAQLARHGAVPIAARAQIAASLHAYPESRFGPDELVVRGTATWLLTHARMGVLVGDATHTKATRSTAESIHEARFPGVADFGNPLQRGNPRGPFVVALRYPDGTAARILLGPPTKNSPTATLATRTVRRPAWNESDDEPATLPPRAGALVPLAIEVDGQRLYLDRESGNDAGPPVDVPAP